MCTFKLAPFKLRSSPDTAIINILIRRPHRMRLGIEYGADQPSGFQIFQTYRLFGYMHDAKHALITTEPNPVPSSNPAIVAITYTHFLALFINSFSWKY